MNFNCPSIIEQYKPSLCIVLPTYKRDYFSFSMPEFGKQTYKPKFYLIIQNDNVKNFNMPYIQSMVNETVYHIWMSNWNSFFFLIHRLASILPCDFILKYDDDQWPNDNNLQQNLIDKIKNKNIIIGLRGHTVSNARCNYTPKIYKNKERYIQDHAAVPLLIRRGYLKFDARNKIFSLYGYEDIALSLNSNRLCNVISITTGMNLRERQGDGNSHSKDKQYLLSIAKEKQKDSSFDIFLSSYCYLIHSGYIPIRWGKFKIPQNDFINITLPHKRLY